MIIVRINPNATKGLIHYGNIQHKSMPARSAKIFLNVHKTYWMEVKLLRQNTFRIASWKIMFPYRKYIHPDTLNVFKQVLTRKSPTSGPAHSNALNREWLSVGLHLGNWHENRWCKDIISLPYLTMAHLNLLIQSQVCHPNRTERIISPFHHQT